MAGDVGGERRLTHRGAAGDDDEVGRLQAAHALVEIGETGGEAGEAAVAAIGVRRHVDGVGEGCGERLEARAEAARLGKLVELLLGLLDLVGGGGVDGRIEGRVDHDLADRDELAADGEVVDGAAVILGVDDGGGVGGEAAKILRHGQLADGLGAVEEGLQRDRGRALAGPDQLGGVVVNAAVQRVVKMLRLEEAGNAVAGLVIDEDRAEEGLLGLKIVRRGAESRGFRYVALENQCVAHGGHSTQMRTGG